MGLKMFHLHKRRSMLHAFLQGSQTVIVRQLILIAWWSLLSVCTFVYDIPSEIRRV